MFVVVEGIGVSSVIVRIVMVLWICVILFLMFR